MRRMQPSMFDIARFQRGLESLDRGEGARHDAERWRVDCSQIDISGQKGHEVRLGQAYHQHRAWFGRLHERATLRDQVQRILEGDRFGDAGCDQFADAVTDHGRRLDAARHPQLRQRVFDQEQGRLRVERRTDGVRGIVAFRGLA